jgi:hypothetical protein
MTGLSGRGLNLTSSTTTLENVLVAGGLTETIRQNAGALTLRHSTVANNTGAGLFRIGPGATTTVTSTVLYGNAGGDLAGTASCTSVSWSDVGSVDCTASNGNLQVNPQLQGDYRLGPSSPCLDHGPSPSTFSGSPKTDLAGGPRLRDWDGNGLATVDIGAYEMENPALVPGEVTNVRWTGHAAMIWDPVATAVEYHVYRTALSSLGYTSFGACRDDLDPDRTDTALADVELPAAGQGFGYLITAENGAASEGTLGFGTAAERSNFNACP